MFRVCRIIAQVFRVVGEGCIHGLDGFFGLLVDDRDGAVFVEVCSSTGCGKSEFKDRGGRNCRQDDLILQAIEFRVKVQCRTGTIEVFVLENVEQFVHVGKPDFLTKTFGQVLRVLLSRRRQRISPAVT